MQRFGDTLKKKVSFLFIGEVVNRDPPITVIQTIYGPTHTKITIRAETSDIEPISGPRGKRSTHKSMGNSG